MARDAIAEWRRALMGRRRAYTGLAKMRELAPPQMMRARGIILKPFDLGKTLPLAPDARIGRDRPDLATAIRVLQRNNRLLRTHFGIGWVEATNFVLRESHRRGTTATLLARTLSSRLRTEAAA